MKKWVLVIDVALCENCNNCFLACKDEYCGNDWLPYSRSQPLHGQRWMNIMRRERGRFPNIDVAYRPTPCMHCGNPACLRTAGSSGAVVQRQDGIVLIDPEKARGNKELAQSCPYGAIWFNEEEQLAQKCTFCAHLLDSGWRLPRCVQACPTGALRAYCLDDQGLAQLVVEEGLTTLEAAASDCRPRCYYKNLARYMSWRVAGSVAFDLGGLTDCGNGITVILEKEGLEVARTHTDDFGDYLFDGLQEKGLYHLRFCHPSQEEQKIQVQLDESVSMPTVWFRLMAAE